MKKYSFFELVPFFKKKREEIEEKIRNAQAEAHEIVAKAEKQALKFVSDSEEKIRSKERSLDQQRREIEKEKENIENQKKQTKQTHEKMLARLEKVATLTKEDARKLILNAWEKRLAEDVASRIKKAEEEIKTTVDEKAREAMADAMRYGAVDYVPEYTLSTVSIPSDEFKGRIIGKEGRNIRAFELATNVDVDLEEEGIIKFSSFDSIRREIARVSMERLIRDGRIQPQRIEEIVKKTTEEVEKIIIKEGEQLCHKAGAYGLPHDIIRRLGMFKYRFSYGQNMILHTLEETKIGIALAHELGADVETVRLGCLLHDIGKVITDKEGSHVKLGVDMLKKHNFAKSVIDCVASHHEDVPLSSVEAVIVYIADAISGGRPGARHEDFEEYLRRIKTLEDAAMSQKGVKEAYALQAGRELRVIVKPDEITDAEATVLAENITKLVEEKFPTFPGQVKVTVIREVRAFATSHS